MNKQVPKIRFRGFTDGWKEYSIGNYANYRRGSFPQPYGNKSWYGGEESMPFVQVVDVGNNLRLVDDTKQKISKLAQPKSVFVPEGKVVVTLQGSIGRVAITQYPAYIDRTLIIFEDYDRPTDVCFWAYVVQNKFEIEKLKAPGGTIKTITKKTLSNFQIFIPGYEEQQKIGQFFKQLDKTIALHQRQLELLKEQKKGFLQKMFPKAGETVPEIRFSGFADDWKQYNLREVATRVRGNDGRMNLPTLTISAGSGWMDQRDRFSKNIAGKEQQNYTLLKKGELSYNHGNSKLAQYGVVFALESYAEVLVPRVYHSFSVSGQSDPKFIEQMFATHRPDRELRKLVSSGARMDGLLNINYDAFMDILIMLPSVAEQQLVASMFSKIDELITLHQHKLEALKEMKKGFLQQMFV